MAVATENDIADFQIRKLEDRMNFDEKINDIRFASMEKLMAERFDRLQEAMEKNLSKYEVLASDIKGEMRAMNERIDKNLAEYKAAVIDVRAELKEDVSEIRGDVKALNAGVQSLQQRRSWDIAWISLAVAVGIALIQIFSK